MASTALPRHVLQSVGGFARTHALLSPGPLVVAVSGGTDSTALLLLLSALAKEAGVVLHVAHFDHRNRRSRAAADAAFVAQLADRCGAAIRIARADVVPRSEDSARIARYEFLRRAGAEIDATAIATGHTRDDQAETVLLHATRGSGLAGLSAMRPKRDGLVRPLLCLTRADTAAVCAAAGIVPREDPTNRTLRFARNRVRHRVMPELARINPQAGAALARLSDAAAAALASLRGRAEVLLAGAMEGRSIALERLGTDAALREEALALAWERVSGRALAARSRAALAAEAERREGSASLDLPGGRALREYGTLRLVAPDAADASVPARRALEPERQAEWNGWILLLTRGARGAEWTHAAGFPGELA
ncbi:hypothetical protein BH18CHL2_BH18CHL2_11130 [soil metagenome]